MAMRSTRRALVLIAAVIGLVAVSLPARPEPSSQPTAPVGADALSVTGFEHPPGDSRPTILWFWNGTITEQLIDQQLADMRAEGIRETVIFPDATATLQPQFFSEGWFAMVDHALREAQRTGMKVWLFNDRAFPSGRAAGYVVDGGTVGDRVYAPHPELRPQSIARSRQTASGPGSFDLRGRFPGLIPPQLSVADGQLAVDGGGVTLLNHGTEWTDYTLSFDTRPLQTASLGGHDYAQAGWAVRAQDPSNGYVYLLGNYPHTGATGGNITRITVVNGRNVGTRVIKLPFDVAGGQSYHVETRVEGSRLITSVDGTVVDDFTDATFGHGTIGFREATGQNESATFDNVRVSALDGTPLYEQTFDSDAALKDFSTPAPADDVIAVAALPVRDGTPDANAAIDLTDRFRAGQPWSVPAGEYKIEYYVRHVRTDFGGDGYLNLFDEEAVRRYIEVVHDEYYRRFAWAFDSGVLRGFWDDEPRIATGYGPEPPWSDLVARNIQNAGSTPAQALAAWYADDGTAGHGARGVLSRADADAFVQAYYKQQGDWARAHHTQIISNPLSDDRPPSWMLRETGDIHKDNQWIQVPGGDAISGHVAPGLRDLSPRYITSDGHQQGAERILHENLGAYGWGVTPALARYVNGSMAVRGVNLTVLHAFWSNPDSVRYPPPLEPSNPWWDDMDGVVDWTGRVMELTRGRAAAPTALLHPQSAAQAWQRTATGDALDADFTAITYAMEDAQVDFDLLDEASLDGDPAMLNQAQVQGNALRIGPQAYRTVVIPPAPTMSLETVQRLQQLVASGGTVIAYGALPEHETQGNDDALHAALDRLFASPGARRVATVAELQQALRDAGAPGAQLTPAAPRVRVLRIMHGDDKVFMLMNEDKDAVDTTATFPDRGTPELWNPEDGSHRVAPVFTAGGAGTAIPLHLDPSQVLAVVFRGDQPVPHLLASPLPVQSVTRSGPQLAARVSSDRAGDFPLLGADGDSRFAGTAHIVGSFDPIPLDGTWRFRFDRDGADWSEQPLGSWTALDRAWSGDATYEKTVNLAADELADGRRLILDLGDVRDVAHVSVNGTPVGRLLWAPYRLDITDALQPGSNQIDVTVTNTPANAHGSAQASGLLGPVLLRPRQELTVPLEREGDG
jgi:hypothetical protein